MARREIGAAPKASAKAARAAPAKRSGNVSTSRSEEKGGALIGGALPSPKRPPLTSQFAAGRERMKIVAKLAERHAAWRPATSVLVPVRSVRTPFVQVDMITRVGGWPIDRITVVHGPSNDGKASSYDTLAMTPRGRVQIGTLSVGDAITASDGTPTRVTGVFPQGEKQLYRVMLSDGTSTECCEEHLWYTMTRQEIQSSIYVRGHRPERKRIPSGRPPTGSVKSLAEILESFKAGDHELPQTGRIQYEPLGELPIEPYLLGLMLGDGSFTDTRFHKAHEIDLLERLVSMLPEGDSIRETKRSCTVRIRGNGLQREIAKLDLGGVPCWEKFVPELYMRASPEDRLELLRGLCDTDGSVVKDGCAVEFSSSSPMLAKQAAELARSLGAYVTSQTRIPYYTYKGEKRAGRPSTRHLIYFDDGTIPVSSEKHLAKWRGRSRTNRRTIESIVPSRVAPAVCIRIEHPSRLYLVDEFIPTHNTAFVLGLGLGFLQQGHLFYYVDAEYTTDATWLGKMLGAEALNPGFLALRPDSYEETVQATSDVLIDVAQMKKKGELPNDLSGLIVIDSLKKLSPKRLLDTLMKEGADGESGRPGRKKAVGIDGMGGRAGQYKAALNSQWMDTLVPQAAKAGFGVVLIAREYDKEIETFFSSIDYQIGGGKNVIFDASIRARVVKELDVVDDGVLYGQRHRVEIHKTKIGQKSERVPQGYFHTSTGMLVPEGFDRARDFIQLGKELGVIETAGAWFSCGGEKIGQGENGAVKNLTENPDLMALIEAKLRAAFAEESRIAP